MKVGAMGVWVPEWDEHAPTIAMHAERYEQFIRTIPINDLETAVDGGAHVGYWTLRMAEHFRRVYAFEPHPDNYACLRENLADAVAENVEVRQAALGNHLGRCTPTKNAHSREDNSGAWHVREDEDGPVLILPLDNLEIEGRLDLLKLDIEGMEALALEGGKDRIHCDWPAIIIEENITAKANFGLRDGLAREYLEDWGYREVAALGRDHLYLHTRRG